MTFLKLLQVAAGGANPQQSIAIDGRLLGMAAASSSSSTEGVQMMQLVQQAMASAGISSTIQQPTSTAEFAKKDTIAAAAAAGVKGQGEGSESSIAAGSVMLQTAQQYKDYQRLMALTGMAIPPVYTMKVEDPVELVKVSFESKSIEIAGEVPIKKIDTENLSSPEKFDLSVDDSGNESKVGADVEVMTRAEKDGQNVVDVVEVGQVVEMKDGGPPPASSLVAGPAGGGRLDSAGGGGVIGNFHGHSSADLLSAELLLSLTGSNKDFHATAAAASKRSTPQAAGSNNLMSSPSGAPSSGRKRKQKPIASAKRQSVSNDEEVKGDLSTTPSSSKRRRTKKLKKDDREGEDGTETSEQLQKNKSKQFTPEELLEILNIPPSTSSKGAKGKSKDTVQPMPMAPGSKASAKMEQLKASRAVKPMKEYVIETDSDSNSSSSSSSSSHFTPDDDDNSNSSSDSSSDSSSNEDSSGGSKVKTTPIKKVMSAAARGRGKGRSRAGHRSESVSSSSDDESGSDEEGGVRKQKGVATMRGRGRIRRRGGGAMTVGRGRGSLPGLHVVSIPTRLLKGKLKQAKKQKNMEVCVSVYYVHMSQGSISSHSEKSIDYVVWMDILYV